MLVLLRAPPVPVHCAGLERCDLPPGLKTVPAWAFEGCTSLREITFPPNLQFIWERAFHGCTSLKAVAFTETLRGLGFSAFHGCISLEHVAVPGPLKALEGSTFRGCTKLSEITFQDTLTELKGFVFHGCTNLTAFTCQSVTAVGKQAFSGCTALVDVALSPKLASVGPKAFENCTRLGELVMPPSITTLGADCLLNCGSMTRVFAPDAMKPSPLVRAEEFHGCPVANCMVPLSAIRPLRWYYWDIPVHTWMIKRRQECIRTVLLIEQRLDNDGTLPSLPHDVWLYLLAHVRRCDFGPVVKPEELAPMYTYYLKSIFSRIIRMDTSGIHDVLGTPVHIPQKKTSFVAFTKRTFNIKVDGENDLLWDEYQKKKAAVMP